MAAYTSDKQNYKTSVQMNVVLTFSRGFTVVYTTQRMRKSITRENFQKGHTRRVKGHISSF